MNKLLLKKVEELTLYMIVQQKELSAALQRIKRLEEEYAKIRDGQQAR